MPGNSFPEKLPFFPQEGPNTCAVACLRMILGAYGVSISEAELAERAATDQFGTELGNLVKAAEGLGFACSAGVFDLETLRQQRFPIVYLDGPTLGRKFLMHAVVVAVIQQSVKVLDPSQGEVLLPLEQFNDAWETAGSYAIVLRRSATAP